MDLALLVLRLAVGGVLVAHGLQKLTGAFGGPGPDASATFFDALRFRDPAMAVRLGGWTETVGGGLLMLGALTPLAAAAVIGVMLTAILVVHLRHGMWNQDGGSEYPLVLAVVAAAVALAGPGALSVDHLLGLTLAGYAWGGTAIFVGVVAAGAALSLRDVGGTRPAAAVVDAEGTGHAGDLAPIDEADEFISLAVSDDDRQARRQRVGASRG